MDFIKKVSFKIVSTAFEDSIESLNQNNMALFKSLIDDLLNKNSVMDTSLFMQKKVRDGKQISPKQKKCLRFFDENKNNLQLSKDNFFSYVKGADNFYKLQEKCLRYQIMKCESDKASSITIIELINIIKVFCDRYKKIVHIFPGLNSISRAGDDMIEIEFKGGVMCLTPKESSISNDLDALVNSVINPYEFKMKKVKGDSTCYLEIGNQADKLVYRRFGYKHGSNFLWSLSKAEYKKFEPMDTLKDVIVATPIWDTNEQRLSLVIDPKQYRKI